MVRSRGSQRGRGGRNNDPNALLTRNEGHASNRAYDDPARKLRARSRQMNFAYDEQIEPILERFGLSQIAKMGSMKVDPNLITAFVERWRRETHSFHLPTGEITPTLEDVSCLWGLPIDGQAVTGLSDIPWFPVLQEVFTEDEFGNLATTPFPHPPRSFNLRVEWLKREFVGPDEAENHQVPPTLPPDSPPEVVRRYAIAFMLDLFGSIMFPDHSGYLYSMLVALVQNTENPPKISWGTAVLAHLYNGLCKASEGNKEVTGPLVFLQMWIWTRVPLGRPVARYFEDGLNGRPLGFRWVGEHNYIESPRGSIKLYRDSIETLEDDEVNWTPYDDVWDELPQMCRDERGLVFYEGPLIWYWMVEAYTPQRVMRQFGRRQIVPPALLPCSDDLHDIQHSGLRKENWEEKHAAHIQWWEERLQHIVPHDEPYDPQMWSNYIAWFNRYGMRTVWWRATTGQALNEPQPLQYVADPMDRRPTTRGHLLQQRDGNIEKP